MAAVEDAIAAAAEDDDDDDSGGGDEFDRGVCKYIVEFLIYSTCSLNDNLQFYQCENGTSVSNKKQKTICRPI
jgi:hypothetical protein